MELELFIRLNAMREQLVKQIADLDVAIILAAPNDPHLLDQTANEIMFGKYDFPYKQPLANQIIFAIGKLSRATISDVQRYFQMLNVIIDDKLVESAAKQLAKEGLLKKRNVIIDEVTKVEYTLEKLT